MQGDPPSVPRSRPKWSAKAYQDIAKFLDTPSTGASDKAEIEMVAQGSQHGAQCRIWAPLRAQFCSHVPTFERVFFEHHFCIEF